MNYIMEFKEELKKAKESIFKQSEKLSGEEIKGPEFNNEMTLSEFINSYSSVGFQASHLGKAIEIIKKMRKDNAKIYLAYTSGIVSSGLRDIVRQLAEKKLIDVIITTTGGLEEDLIKTFKPFLKGSFDVSGKDLRERGINRIGNIFVPNDRYCLYEDWTFPILKEIFEEQKKGKNITPSYIVKKFGEKINDKNSIYYWANKNNIPVYLPAPLDGSTGDMIYFFKQSNPEFKIDVTQDLKELIDYTIQQEKTGIIVLGAGVIKHHVCNANLFRDGADYAVYINAAQEFDGSDAGATPNEAISWGKIKSKKEQNTVKVYSDATLVFPLIAAEAFQLIKTDKTKSQAQ